MKDYDVIVVGAGNAALAAAVSARENGAERVLVLEKAPREMRGGNTYWAGAGLRFSFDDARELLALLPKMKGREAQFCATVRPYPVQKYVADLMEISGGQTDQMLCRMLAETSKDTVVWMTQFAGIELEQSDHHAREFGGLEGGKLRLSAPGIVVHVVRGGPGLSDGWFDAAERLGVEVRYGAAGSDLAFDERGRASVVKVRDARGVHTLRAGSVVLGCGGYEANVQMRTQHMGARIGQAMVRGTPHNQGDGLRMALNIGAMPAGQWSGCHSCPVGADLGTFVSREVGNGSGRNSYLFGLMINRNGQRFLDEGEASYTVTYAKYGRAILDQPGAIAYQIFDAQVSGLLGKSYKLSKPVVADTLEGLIAQLDIVDKDGALKTLRDFNSAANDFSDGFDPTREDGLSTRGIAPVKSNWALRLSKPPFVAYAVTGGITFTFGGLKIDESAQVVGTDWRPMPGLYACGEMVGGLFYDNYAAAAGLMWGAVSGRIAGRSAARDALLQEQSS